jgi:hypothetical protein
MTRTKDENENLPQTVDTLLRDRASEEGLAPPGAVLTEFVVVANFVQTSGRPFMLYMSTEGMFYHHVSGLLTTCLELLKDGAFDSDPDNEEADDEG